MGKTSVYVDKADPASIETLLSIFEAQNTEPEEEIRSALSPHKRPFTLNAEHINRVTASSLRDANSWFAVACPHPNSVIGRV